MKQVRPAYDSSETAPNQPMYSGGYRQNMHQNVQYPVSGARPEHRPWQQDRDNTTMPPSKNMEKFDVPRVSDRTRVGDREEPKRSRSRSPVRRDRSPIKDRYKRHSPSPRSPRRSWALEKRQSPEIHEAPPPPIWPSQNSRDCDYSKQNRPIYSERVDNSNQKHVPTWDLPPFEEKTDNSGNQKRPSDDRFTQNNPISVHQDLQKWKSNLEAGNQKSPTRNPWDRQDQGFSERLRESLNFTPREEFARSGGDQRMQYSDNQDLRLRKHTLRQDHQDESRLKDDLPRRRDDFSRRYDDNREVFRSTELSKETGDVYKRIGEYGQKTQEYRKKDSRFDDQHMDDRFIQSTRDEEMNQHSRDDRKDYRYGTRFEPREQVKQREPEWITALKVKQATMQLNPGVKAKRDKAVEEITRRIMNKFEHELSNEIKGRVRDELILSISRILFDMFKKEDVSYIEIIIKFNAKFDHADEEKIFEEVMSSFPSHYRNKKRAAQGSSQVPAKTAKLDPKLVPGGPKGTEYQSWNVNIMSTLNVMNTNVVPQLRGIPQIPQMPVLLNPSMVPPPQFMPHHDLGYMQEGSNDDGYNLFLCKDHFQPFTEIEADLLKNFIVAEMFTNSENSYGWAPEFKLKGLQTMFRYEIATKDERSKDWLMNLNFRDFRLFNVVVYTNEELWYERAAIWLPGHSRCRIFDPFEKLKLQNRQLEGIHIGKWKFVKKIITVKGTRIYVDLPPSSARALEIHNMMLSYELQKVNVFLKAIAVDKHAFDAGLSEISVVEVPNKLQNSTMPSLGQENNVIKIGLKGEKRLSVEMARKVRDMIIFKLFKYLRDGGNSRTDFTKYGFCAPGYLGIVPENAESKRWLKSLEIGKVNRQPVMIIGTDVQNMKYITMFIQLPFNHTVINSALACEKLKQSNQGVKGINFNYWKNARIMTKNGTSRIEVGMDVESVETIAKLNYELDYVEDGQDTLTLKVKSFHSESKLQEMIKKYKAETTDTYVVSNMEIDSETDDDVVCLD